MDYREKYSTQWDISPLCKIRTKEEGFFVIGAKWGEDITIEGSSSYEKLVPPTSVCYIEEMEKWEKPKEGFIKDEELNV